MARWLRTMGYDAADYREDTDRGFLETARKEGRVALTRKREMVRREFRGTLIVVEEDRVEDQIRALAKLLFLEAVPERLFERCLDCNVQLVGIAKDKIKSEVPEYVFATQVDFRCCPKCGKIFWPATHRERALAYLENCLAPRR